jgi:uncharacterized protein (DUF885 family)
MNDFQFCGWARQRWSEFVFAVGLVGLLQSSLAICQSNTVADQQLDRFYRDHLEQTFLLRPLDATFLGDHRYDHLLDDISKEARARWLKFSKDQLIKLQSEIKLDSLSADGQIDYQILRDELLRSIWLAEHTKPFEEDPRTYGSYINDSIYSLLTQSTLPRETNIANAISRMKEIPRIVDVAKATIHNPPRSILETAVGQNKGAIGFFDGGLDALIGDSPQKEQVKAAAKDVVTKLKEYQVFLEETVLPHANGQWRLGKALFSKKLEMTLDVGRTADEVLLDAQTEFERVQRELYFVSKQLWHRYFPKSVLPPDDVVGRREVIASIVQAVSQEHGEPSALIVDARKSVEGIKKFISENGILKLPATDRCQIIEMPEFRRGNSLAYLDSALPLDPNGSSFYAVSPPPSIWDSKRVKSFLEEYNRHMLQILTIHEAYPGHYVQLEYSNRCPSLIRRILQSGVFIEGWAVYTEQMMLDQGYGQGDLALRLNQLKFYLRAVANAILDHKMHCTEMTDQEALGFLTQEAYQSDGEARLKIVRAKQSSVQLSTYFVGRMAHYRLRQSIQRELGHNFKLDQYHEAVLGHGSVPVRFLPDLVRRELAKSPVESR